MVDVADSHKQDVVEVTDSHKQDVADVADSPSKMWLK